MGNVITITPGGTPAGAPEGGLDPAVVEQLGALAERTQDEPRWLDRDVVPDRLRALAPVAVEQARRDLEPSRPAKIVTALVQLAERHDLNVPDRRALELDAEIMAAWPRELWRRAYLVVWEEWVWPRLPTVGEFRRPIAEAIEQRRRRYDRLVTLEARLRARTKPQSVAECVAALERAGPGVRQTWFQAARRRDPQLTTGDAAELGRWVPLVAARMATVGLFGRAEP
jgi:hypothetical protein